MSASERFVALRDGPTVPLAPLLLLLSLEERGLHLREDGDVLVVQPAERLTADDCAAIRRWKWHLLMLMDYRPPLAS